MKKLLLSLGLSLFLISCTNDPNPCTVAGDFIKKDLYYPQEADISAFDCKQEKQADGNYRVLQKITGKNAFGESQSRIYEVVLKYNGGDKLDESGWDLVSIRSEKYID